jgi:hypothetical protein
MREEMMRFSACRQIDQREVARVFMRAGPRALTYFNPSQVKVGSVWDYSGGSMGDTAEGLLDPVSLVGFGIPPPTYSSDARARRLCSLSAPQAAIVTCGGICPGLNNVIRELVFTLHYSYGVEAVYGIQGGYWGFHTPDAVAAPPGTPPHPNAPTSEPPLLTPEAVKDIHNFGGTILGADR